MILAPSLTRSLAVALTAAARLSSGRGRVGEDSSRHIGVTGPLETVNIPPQANVGV